jgi:Tfp pilus assembly protein PilN
VSQVNLLPPEIKERAKVRQRTTLVVLGVIGVLALIGAYYVLQTMNLSSVEDELAAQEQTNAGLQTQISSLQEFGDLQTQLADKEALRDSVFAGEVQWSGILMDLSRVIPSDAVIDSFAGTVAATGAADALATDTTTGPTGIIGTMTFSGTVADLESATMWLSRQAQVKGWVNPFTTTLTETAPRSRQYTFSSTTDLTDDLVTERGRAAKEGV